VAQPKTSRTAADLDPDALTDREREVLELLVQGVTTNRKLAKTLAVSENTVKFHVRNILDKLHLDNRAQAVSYALRHRLVALPEPGS
jgi:DNA-binding NarL/FixJ family response regulator